MTPTETRVIKSMTQEERIESGYAFAKECEREFSKDLPKLRHGVFVKIEPAGLEFQVGSKKDGVPIPKSDIPIEYKDWAWLLARLRPTPAFVIDRVIFNDPATVVYWKDGTKTVVKCQLGDKFSKETGLAVAFMKKALGNKGNFNDIFRKWVYEDE